MLEKKDRIRVRDAAGSDVQRLSEIAWAAKAHWGYPRRWLEIWRPQLTVLPEHIRDNPFRLAETDAGILGFYGLSRAEEKMILEHLWVDPKAMGGGIGRLLFEDAKNHCAQCGYACLEIDSDPHAEGFYRRMGAEKVGERHSLLEGRPRILPILLAATSAASA